MLRHILHELEWLIILAIATLILFLMISLLTIQPVIATITETDIAPGRIHCRSEPAKKPSASQKLPPGFQLVC